MKRLFPIAMGFMTVGALSAQTTPAVYPDAPFQRFSPDGKWAVQDAGDMNPMTILNFVTNDEYSYYEEYSGGSGNYISNTGVVVGRNAMNEQASYWQNGNWKALPVPPNTSMSFANGLTPDGSRIIGTIAPQGYAGDNEGTMTVPCYWDLQADGSYAEMVLLPHPTRDYSNRPPQYITAVRISDDGKTIAGQMRDYLGMASQLLVYKQNEKGEWSYEVLLNDLFHPADYELPKDPGDGPIQQDFMTEEEIRAYEAALRAWEMGANNDYSTYPDIEEYMTEEEYNTFLQTFATWNEEWEEFNDALWKLLEIIPNFSYNNVFMTSDGKFMASTDAKVFQDELNGIYEKQYVPYLIDITTGKYTKFEPVNDINIMVSSLCDDCTILGQNQDDLYRIFNGYILPSGASEFMELTEFMKESSPATYEWMEKNMTHDFIAIDPETFQEYQATPFATGIPFATPDMSIIGFAQYEYWIYDYDSYIGYLISLPPYAGVESLELNNNITVKSLGNGELLFEGNVKSLDIFNLNGMKVFSRSEPDNRIHTNLHEGIYIIRVQNHDGKFNTDKIHIN